MAIGPRDQTRKRSLRSLCTLRPQLASGADLGICSVSPTLLVFVVTAPVQGLTRGTAKDIGFRIVDKFRDVENAVLLGHAFRTKNLHVRPNTERLEVPEVFPGSIVLIADNRFGSNTAGAMMLLGQGRQTIAVAHVPGGRFDGGDHTTAIVDCAMALVARSRGRVGAPRVPRNERGIRVRLAEVDPVHRYGPPFLLDDFKLRFLHSKRLTKGQDHFRRILHHRRFRRVSIHQAAIDVDLLPVDQSELHTLFDGSYEETLEGLMSPTSPRLRQHAVIGNLIIEPKAKEPEIIQSLRHDSHEFPLALDVVEEKEEQELQDHLWVHGLVPVVAIVVRDVSPHPRKVDPFPDRTKRVVPPHTPVQVDLVAEQILLRCLDSHHNVAIMMAYLSGIQYIDTLLHVCCRRNARDWQLSRSIWATAPNSDVTRDRAS